MHRVFRTSKYMLIKGSSEDVHCTSALRDFSDFISLKQFFLSEQLCRSPLVEQRCGCLSVCAMYLGLQCLNRASISEFLSW